MAIYQALCARRQDTVDNLALEFDVSEKTIRRDIEDLMCSYPIKTVRGRYGGGVKMEDWHNPRKTILSREQHSVLTQLLDKADESQRRVLLEMLTTFG
jgi:predicted DNA-binding transcriptional regulator YafY